MTARTTDGDKFNILLLVECKEDFYLLLREITCGIYNQTFRILGYACSKEEIPPRYTHIVFNVIEAVYKQIRRVKRPSFDDVADLYPENSDKKLIKFVTKTLIQISKDRDIRESSFRPSTNVYSNDVTRIRVEQMKSHAITKHIEPYILNFEKQKGEQKECKRFKIFRTEISKLVTQSNKIFDLFTGSKNRDKNKK